MLDCRSVTTLQYHVRSLTLRGATLGNPPPPPLDPPCLPHPSLAIPPRPPTLTHPTPPTPHTISPPTPPPLLTPSCVPLNMITHLRLNTRRLTDPAPPRLNPTNQSAARECRLPMMPCGSECRGGRPSRDWRRVTVCLSCSVPWTGGRGMVGGREGRGRMVGAYVSPRGVGANGPSPQKTTEISTYPIEVSVSSTCWSSSQFRICLL